MESDARLLHSVAVVVRKLREQKKYSQEHLAAEADLSRSMIDKIERRKRLPSLPVILKIAGALNIKASEIIAKIEQEMDR
ncbi:helix-turn-helix domain-containing protein [Gracilimonas tropica]|uniref:helix-turn-helix domain-containing protein n=1 Tax=Gracilimonas tropica TaxID=454600 RepID=UPI0003704AE8|nr:helix-turn-helix transcriptional regulator [Gracilimonas tropica]